MVSFSWCVSPGYIGANQEGYPLETTKYRSTATHWGCIDNFLGDSTLFVYYCPQQQKVLKNSYIYLLSHILLPYEYQIKLETIAHYCNRNLYSTLQLEKDYY